MRYAMLPSLLLCCLTSLPAAAEAAPELLHFTPSQLQGDIFRDPRSLTLNETSDAGTVTARDLVVHESGDRCLQTGVYQTGANSYPIDEPYPHDEFMYFLDGGVTLTPQGGIPEVIAAGDAVLIPKGWLGSWDSAGYRKIYLIYDCPD